MPKPTPGRDAPPVRRMTKQKQAIYHNVMNRCDHPTAQEVHEALASLGIGLATVYRNLAMLANDGVISTVEHEGELRYDCNNRAHGHATCTSCGRLWDIPLPDTKAPSTVTGLADVEEVEWTLRGLCNACA
jgi:Fur family peroxide stress response transcriptional regulator